MFKRFGYYFALAVFLVDMLWLASAWGLAYQVRFYSDLFKGFRVSQEIPPTGPYFRMTGPLLVIFAVFFVSSGLYRTRRIWPLQREIFHVGKVCLLAMTFFVAFLYATNPSGQTPQVNRPFLAIFLILALAGFLVLRILQRALLESLRAAGYYVRKTLLIGEGESAVLVHDRLTSNPELGFHFVGMLNRDGHSHAPGLPPVLGGYDEVDRVVREQHVQQALIALPSEDYPQLDALLEHLGQEFIDVRVIPDLFKYNLLQHWNTTLEGIPMVCLNEPAFNSRALFVKRAMDLLLSVLAIVLSGPLMLVIAVAIKLSSRGPILYVQERMGLDGQRFFMLKFRTMPVNVEAETGPVWATAGDSRPTRLGAFLRKTSLDEFPQFFNVFVGHMSLVGPRPERPVFVEDFRRKVPGYVLRHKVKAGITGWAQVNGWRGNTSLEKRIEHDLYYIENWSLVLDIKILLMTIRYGLIHPHAY
ncbi:MAG: undecaprenyl-phosphate glucose phosphotransferase [Planctomycetes bacterium]|nr:undecaprenyl-phosphate glucose phosphotransferase [Planctomycetota bacterium]